MPYCLIQECSRASRACAHCPARLAHKRIALAGAAERDQPAEGAEFARPGARECRSRNQLPWLEAYGENRRCGRDPFPCPLALAPANSASSVAWWLSGARKELAHILKRAGGVWEPGSRRWLVEQRPIGPVIRALESATDPLFRRAGLVLE